MFSRCNLEFMEQNGDAYTLSSCVQFLTNKCSTQSATKSLNEKVGAISKSGKSPKKGGDQKSIPRSPANEGEKEKQKPTPEALKKQKEVETYIKDKKLLHICWKCKQDAIDGLKKMSEIKEYPKRIEHNTRAINSLLNRSRVVFNALRIFFYLGHFL